ncbi:hypothetical protein [Nostoc sp.]
MSPIVTAVGINQAQVQKRVSLTIAIYPLLAIANFIGKGRGQEAEGRREF